jgi:hypothetical protein
MARPLGEYVRAFFTNWEQADMPLSEKLRLTFKNRLAATTKGCCGHPGEPGC